MGLYWEKRIAGLQHPPEKLWYTTEYFYVNGGISIKIGDFSRKYNISKETIRYYVDEKLLLPHRTKHYYDYNPQCERDILSIKQMKELDFSISEIKEVLNYLRINTLFIPNLNEFLLEFYGNKLKMVDEERAMLDNREKELKEKITSIKASVQASKSHKPVISGIDLRFLPLLCCNKCGHDLQLKQVDIVDGEIINGVLGCSCGMEYAVQDGILIFEGVDEEKKAPSFNTREDVEKRFPSGYTSAKTLVETWLYEKILPVLKKGEKILDISITGGIYSLPLFEDLKKKDILYIACERWLDYLKISKKAVDNLPKKPKTMFCSGDIRYAPFKPALFDKIIDVYSTIVDMRETGDFKIQHKISFLKDFGQLYGAYYDISNLSNENSNNTRKSLNFSLIERELQKLTKVNSISSPKTKELGEMKLGLKKTGQEELTVYGYIGKKEKD